MAYQADIDVFKSIIENFSILGLCIETRRTVPTMRHLSYNKNMSLILSPFNHRYTIALSLNYILFNQLQTMQFFLYNFDKRRFVLLSIKIQNGFSLIDFPFLQTQSQTFKYILFIIQHLTSINHLSSFASQAQTLSTCTDNT